LARILVIDDEPMIRTLLRHELEPLGHEVILAEEGIRGVALAKRQRPDLVILDLMMPILDGHAVMEMLQRDEKTARIPVIVLTAVTLEAVRRQCLGEGATCVLTKPFDAEQLSKVIGEALEESRSVEGGASTLDPSVAGGRPQ
jgi:two-component system response regulator RpaA